MKRCSHCGEPLVPGKEIKYKEFHRINTKEKRKQSKYKLKINQLICAECAFTDWRSYA